MKSVVSLFFIAFAAICLSTANSYAAESQLARALEGAKSIHVNYLVNDEPGCKVVREALEKDIQESLTSYPALKVIPEMATPDVLMIVRVDVMAIPPGSLPVDACMYLVSLRTYHPMLGRYAYKSEPHFIRALTFDRTAYSVIFPEKISDAVRIQAIRLLKIFYAAHGAEGS